MSSWLSFGASAEQAKTNGEQAEGLCGNCCRGSESKVHEEKVLAVVNVGADSEAGDGTAKAGDVEAPSAEDGGGFIAGMLEKAKDTLHDVVEDAAEKVQDAKEYIAEQAEAVQDAVMESTVGPKIRAFEEVTKKFHEQVEHWMKQQIIAELELILDKLPSIIKTSLNQDPDMIQFVWRRICRMIDKSWPDIRVELLEDIETQLGLKDPPEKRNLDEDKRLGFFASAHAFCRYSLDPFDRSFWGKVKNPLWIVMTFVMLIPVSYVSALGFLFLFIVIDKSDEYQLCNFILVNKNCQFLAQGLIRVFVGYFQYLDCVTAPANPTYHECENRGPGQWGPVWMIISGWLLQVLLSWVAMLILPFALPHVSRKEKEIQAANEAALAEVAAAEQKPAEGEQPEQTEEEKASAPHLAISAPDFNEHLKKANEARQRFTEHSVAIMTHLGADNKKNLRRMVMYDAIVSFIVFGIVAWRLAAAEEIDSFLTRQTIFTAQVIYGLLSLPFFIFTLPFVQRVLLHCHRTGYDVLGQCRFYRGPVKPERRPPTSSISDGVSTEDITELFGKVMGALGGADATASDLDAHDFSKNCTAMRPLNCKHCGKYIPHPRQQAWTCTYCRVHYCADCTAITEDRCTKARKFHEKKEKQEAEEEKEAEDEADEKSKSDRYAMFSSLWTLSGTVVKAITCVDGSSESVERFKAVMKAALRKASNKQLEAIIDRIPTLLKWMGEDDDMPEIMRDAKDNLVDGLWKDLREEILFKCKAALAPALDKEAKELRDKTEAGVDCFRAKFRHAEHPCDRSIFWQVKQPLWWLLRLVTLIPWGGIQPLVFLFLFIITDKTDEFQLVQFILLFKGTQFISHGIIKTLIGFFQYVSCTATEVEGPDRFNHACEDIGPGIVKGTKAFEVMFGGWILMILLVWVSFMLLPCSSDKAREELAEIDPSTKEALKDFEANETDPANDVKKEESQDAKRGSASKAGGLQAGGKIRYLLWWDMIAFFAAIAVMIWIMTTRPYYDEWVVIHTFFGCQVVYGYMSLPFFIFSIPVLRDALTHSVQSGYDEKGRIRPLDGPGEKDPKVLEEQLKWLEEDERRMKKARGIEVEEPQADEDASGVHGLLTKVVHVFKVFFGFESDEEENKDGEKKDGEKDTGHDNLFERVGKRLPDSLPGGVKLPGGLPKMPGGLPNPFGGTKEEDKDKDAAKAKAD